MTTIVLKVSDILAKELALIEEKEGLGNRTAAIAFLIKYYFLTKQNSLDQSIATLNTLLDHMEVSKLASAEEQLKDV